MIFRMSRKRLALLMVKSIIITVSFALSGCIQESSQPAGQNGKGQQPAGMTTDKTQPNASLQVQGATLFAQFCTSCHGKAGNGRGNQRGPSLQRPELTYGRTQAAITQSIRDGRPGGMPSFGHVFNAGQLEALSVYVLSLKK